jgi:hypothetical protein
VTLDQPGFKMALEVGSRRSQFIEFRLRWHKRAIVEAGSAVTSELVKKAKL